MDVQEIDAASHTGVDNVREIRDSIRYVAAPGKHRIFIIDEVHMLSGAAFNALLKTLEEPPPNSLFIFATTDPQKIPITVLSRVTRFDLKRLSPQDLLGRLQQITTADGIEIPEKLLRGIIREADGSARDALTLLDRLVSGFGTKISEEDGQAVLDLVDRRILLDILDPILAQDPAAALDAVRRGLDKGIDPGRLCADLLEELRHHLIASLVKEPTAMLELADDEVQDIQERARPHGPETFQRLFRVLLTRSQDLAFAPRPAHAVEMAIARLATLPSSESLQSLIARLDALETGPGPAGPTSGGGSGSGGRAARPASGGGASSARRPSSPSESGRRSGPPRGRADTAAQADAAPPEAGAEVHSLDNQREVRLRQEAKADPAVQRVIKELDAELREIRMQKRGQKDG